MTDSVPRAPVTPPTVTPTMRTGSDAEQTSEWLQGLRRLNETIAATGHALGGNLCYADLQVDFVSSAPTPLTRHKRDRFRAALRGRRRLLEVGVNGGHSAYVALTDNPELEFHGIDICEHPYVRPAVAHLQAEFPGRVFLHAGDSRDILSNLAPTTERFDAFHIDGAKHLYYIDILNCASLISHRSATIIVDDTQLRSVAWVWRSCVRHGVIVPDRGFPPMSAAVNDRNLIGELQLVSTWRRRLLSCAQARVPVTAAPIVSFLRQARATIDFGTWHGH